MKVEFNPLANDELVAAHAYYESRLVGLGDDFVAEVSRGLRTIDAMPNSWQAIRPGTRRFLLDRFPYGLVYQVRDDTIRVMAVAHLRRRPGYWRGRK